MSGTAADAVSARPREAARVTRPRQAPIWLLPTVAAVVMLVAIYALQPLALTYTGLTLLMGALFPLVLATLAQMFVVASGDLDLGIGSFVGLVNVIAAVYLAQRTGFAVLLLLLLVVSYAGMGALIVLRRLPAIIVTLGMSFVWLGLAIIVLPSPGGAAPQWLVEVVRFAPPVVPGIVVGIALATLVCSWLLMRTRYGVVLRGTGSNPTGVARAGWSVLRAKMATYALAGVFGVLSGLVIAGQTASGDATIAQSYVLLTIAGVVVGGGSFAGGAVSPGGTVAGALVIGLIAPLLQFLGISSNYQVGTQGLVLILILVLRAAVTWVRRRSLGATA